MILPYIINVAVILLACLAFYKLLLRRETFYKVNRFFLIACLAISFALPLIHVPQQFSLRKPTSAVIQQPSLIVTEQVQQSPPNIKQEAKNTDNANNAPQTTAVKA